MIILGGLIVVLIVTLLVLSFKKWFLTFWLAYERLFKKLFHLKIVDKQNPFFYYRIRPFKGALIVMPNGEELRKGDLIAELHFDNERLYRLGTESGSYVQLAIKLIRLAQKQLPKVVEILNKPENQNVKAVYGISMVNRGVKQIGFEVLEMKKGAMYFSTLMYLRFLVSVIHPSGRERLKINPDDLVPKIMVHPAHEAFNVKDRTKKNSKKAHDATTDSMSPA